MRSWTARSLRLVQLDAESRMRSGMRQPLARQWRFGIYALDRHVWRFESLDEAVSGVAGRA